MPRKSSPKTNKAACDRLFSQIVRARGRCERCGTADRLECAHIVGRNYAWTRTDLENAWCLCTWCHRETHADPAAFMALVELTVGLELYDALWLAARQGVGAKFDWTEERARLKSLHAELVA